ncbi:MAG TPA: hypothetical protein VNO33_21225, partial [Kofleriaceae bacterium]|nr:hypothetical protein [Kofleriaceae bacterium]
MARDATPQRLSIEQFRQLHPWPAEQRALGRPIEWLWCFDLPVSPSEAWSSVGDTERTNRAAGLTTLHYSEVGGELVGSHVTAGVRHEFVERWQWIGDSSIELVREYRSGFARLMRNTYRFEVGPDGRGTRLHVYYGWIPRGALGPLAIRFGMHFYERRFRALVDRIRSRLEPAGPGAGHEAAEVMRQPAPRLDQDRQLRVTRLREALRLRGV